MFTSIHIYLYIYICIRTRVGCSVDIYLYLYVCILGMCTAGTHVETAGVMSFLSFFRTRAVYRSRPNRDRPVHTERARETSHACLSVRGGLGEEEEEEA